MKRSQVSVLANRLGCEVSGNGDEFGHEGWTKYSVTELDELERSLLNPCGSELYELFQPVRDPKLVLSELLEERTSLLQSGLLNEFICPICQGICKNATSAKECHHRFCHECIHKWLRAGQQHCPVCNAKIPSRRALHQDDVYQTIVQRLFPDIKRFEDTWRQIDPEGAAARAARNPLAKLSGGCGMVTFTDEEGPTERDGTEHDGTEQDGTEQDGTEQDGTDDDSSDSGKEDDDEDSSSSSSSSLVSSDDDEMEEESSETEESLQSEESIDSETMAASRNQPQRHHHHLSQHQLSHQHHRQRHHGSDGPRASSGKNNKTANSRRSCNPSQIGNAQLANAQLANAQLGDGQLPARRQTATGSGNRGRRRSSMENLNDPSMGHVGGGPGLSSGASGANNNLTGRRAPGLGNVWGAAVLSEDDDEEDGTSASGSFEVFLVCLNHNLPSAVCSMARELSKRPMKFPATATTETVGYFLAEKFVRDVLGPCETGPIVADLSFVRDGEVWPAVANVPISEVCRQVTESRGPIALRYLLSNRLFNLCEQIERSYNQSSSSSLMNLSGYIPRQPLI